MAERPTDVSESIILLERARRRVITEIEIQRIIGKYLNEARFSETDREIAVQFGIVIKQMLEDMIFEEHIKMQIDNKK